tara:strand:+ start:9435 stop:10163 length:729 start_codon:yes stop_codon:yes gene_type:complete
MTLEKYTYNAINLLRNSNSGVLSTISKKNNDYPFGSLTTFITCRNRTIYFYLSDIAQHTINFKNNSKACLTILSNKKEDDTQNSQRLTLMGDIKDVAEEDLEYCKNKFHYVFPESKKYAQFHGFNFYQLEINSVRWIGGFGKISWLDLEDWKKNIPEWKNAENSIIDHMNKDHSNSIVSSLNAQHSIKDKNANMIFITIDGYHVKCKKGCFFIQLDKTCNTTDEYRKELIKLAEKYRKYEVK